MFSLLHSSLSWSCDRHCDVLPLPRDWVSIAVPAASNEAVVNVDLPSSWPGWCSTLSVSAVISSGPQPLPSPCLAPGKTLHFTVFVRGGRNISGTLAGLAGGWVLSSHHFPLYQAAHALLLLSSYCTTVYTHRRTHTHVQICLFRYKYRCAQVRLHNCAHTHTLIE